MNEHNIIKQMIEYDIVNEQTPKHWLDYVNDVWNIHTNTLNNEQETYKNIEQERFDKENTIFSANDFGLNLFDNELLRIGHCLRELFFQAMNSHQDQRDYNMIFELERNILIKKQWKEKLSFCGLLSEPKNEVIDFMGLPIRTTEDGFLYDYERKKEYALLIKPVNESSQTIKKRLFSNYSAPRPLLDHIPEIILNIILLKKPVKVLYVGKNKANAGVELNFGIVENKLQCNEETFMDLDVKLIFQDLKKIRLSLQLEKIPDQSYFKERSLNYEEVNDLLSNEIIQEFQTKNLLNGGTYTSYQCSNCRYRSVCDMNATNERTITNN